jgi:NADH-quinone oxidoreductase subunit M
MPIYAAFFGFFMFASIGLPGLSGFVGEFLAILGSFESYRWAGAIAMLVVIFSAWYMMWMFQRVVWERAPGEPPDANDPELRAPVSDLPSERLKPVMGGSGADDHFIDPRTFKDINWKEIITLAPLAVLTLWIGVYPSTVMDFVKPALQAILLPFGGSGF